MAVFADEILCGGNDGDLLTVRHLGLRGTNFSIGQDLARIWSERHHGTRRQFDPLLLRAQREWMSANWPQVYARLGGASALLGVDLETDTFPLLGLPYNLPDALLPPEVGSGCSCVFYPPSTTHNGCGSLARNLDYPISSLFAILGMPEPPGSPVHVSQPYLIETRPTSGMATLVLCYFDLMTACLDGINSAGLTIALLQDAESVSAGEIAQPQGAGAQDGMLPRLILETCETVDDAKVAFLKTKHAYLEPAHYIVADAKGCATIAEYSKYRSIHFTDIEADTPLCVTNHLVFPHEATPSTTLEESKARLKRLQDATRSADSFDVDQIRRVQQSVHATQPLDESPVRTIWTSIWNIDRRNLEIDFYLGDADDGTIRRSERLGFGL